MIQPVIFSFEVFDVLARLDISSLVVRSGVGTHELTFRGVIHGVNLDPKVEPAEHATVLLSGYLWLPPTRPFAQLPTTAVVLRAWPSTFTWSLHLSDEQLAALHSQLPHGMLELVLNLTATTLGDGGGYRQAEAQETLRVPRSDWIAALSSGAVEFGVTVHVASPLTAGMALDSGDSTDTPSFARAVERLRQARQRLLEHDAEGCVQDCRKILELLRQVRGIPTGSELDPKARKRDAEQRWAALHDALFQLASSASHDDAVTVDIQWRLADAEAVLATTAALLARYRR